MLSKEYTISGLALAFTVAIGIGGWYTSSAITGVRVDSLAKASEQQQKAINILTVQNTKILENNANTERVIEKLSVALGNLADSNHGLALAVNGFGVRLESLEGEVNHLRSSFERGVGMAAR